MEDDSYEPEFNVVYNDTWSLCVAFGQSGRGGDEWYINMRVRLYWGHHFEEQSAVCTGPTIAALREGLEPIVRKLFFDLENRMLRHLYVKNGQEWVSSNCHPRLAYHKGNVRFALVQRFWMEPELSTTLPKDCRIYCDPAIFFI